MREHNDRRDGKGKITEPTREAKVQVCQAYLPKIGHWTSDTCHVLWQDGKTAAKPCFI